MGIDPCAKPPGNSLMRGHADRIFQRSCKMEIKGFPIVLNGMSSNYKKKGVSLLDLTFTLINKKELVGELSLS